MNIIGWPDICQPNQPMIFTYVHIPLFFNIHLYMIWHLVWKSITHDLTLNKFVLFSVYIEFIYLSVFVTTFYYPLFCDHFFIFSFFFRIWGWRSWKWCSWIIYVWSLQIYYLFFSFDIFYQANFGINFYATILIIKNKKWINTWPIVF